MRIAGTMEAQNNPYRDLASVANSATANTCATNASASPITEPFTESMINRLHSVLSTLGDANEDLNMLNDRMFGPSVQLQSGGAGAGMAVPSAPSRSEILFELVESLQRRASSVTSLARGLNSRI